MGFLSRYEIRILDQFTQTLIPISTTPAQRPEEVRTVECIENHLGFLPKNYRLLFRFTLFLFELGAIFFSARPFTRLSQKEPYLEKWRTSHIYPVRLLFKLLESISYVAYYSRPEVNQRLGFSPPPVPRPQTPSPFAGIPDKDLSLTADVCVIGSGAGGAVVAKELAEKGRSVIILEEGAYYSSQDFGKEPLEIVQKIYRGAGLQTTLGLPSILLPTGRAVGGTTLINSGTCFRLPDKVIERWQKEFGLLDLSPEILSPYFDRVEKNLHVSPVAEAILGNNAKIFRRGLENMGLQGSPLRRNAKDCQGAGMCCFGCPNDAKQSVHLSYIPQAIRHGAKLFTHCEVTSFIPRQKYGGEVIARFLDPHTGKHKHTLRVDAEVVVLAAGTLNTPRLLRRSGMAYHRHIGRHLSIHPAVKVVGLFNEEVRGWEGVPQGFCYEGLSEEGLCFEGIFTPPSFGSAHLDLPPRLHQEVMNHYRHLASFGFMVTDEGRGWIRWLPNGDSLIYYSLQRREVAKFIKGIRFLSEVFFKAGAQKVFTGLHRLPVMTPETLEALDTFSFHRSDLQLAAFHPLGTCRMGVDPSQSVVNGVGEVHSLQNLFIADGSIFPSPLGVNPQETIMAFATRTADYIDKYRL